VSRIRVRRSTAITALIFIVTLVLYILVRPEPASSQHASNPSSSNQTVETTTTLAPHDTEPVTAPTTAGSPHATTTTRPGSSTTKPHARPTTTTDPVFGGPGAPAPPPTSSTSLPTSATTATFPGETTTSF